MCGRSRRFVPRPMPTLTNEQVDAYLREKLRDYNDRDAETINRHIRGLRDALEQSGNDVLPTRFGGSVSRHTYVDGLSDVDVILIVNDSSLSGRDPSVVIQRMAELIQHRMPRTQVSTGHLAVTVTYADGHEIQVLPAIRTKAGIRIANPGRNEWSGVLHPERFSQKLTDVNQANGGRVIPAIKLTKALANHVIRSDKDKINGYHVESLAIDAFKNYRGPTDRKSMVSHLLEFSSSAVMQPIRDSTGQSRFVDDYMGRPGSDARQKAATNFRQLKERLERARSESDLDNLFE